MGYAVSLWFDPASEDAVRAIWKRLHDRMLSTFLWTGPFRPHVTLAVYETLNIPLAAKQVQGLLLETKAFEIALPLIGCFTSPPGSMSTSGAAVFLGVTPTVYLLQLHAEVHRLLGMFGHTPKPFYLPSRWNPHCTIAREIAAEAIPEIIRATQETALPLIVTVTRIGIIDTPTEIELECYNLRE
jgi:2'-5' RNA ligase